MLPPDMPSTLFPWLVVVPAMQVYGCFPYRLSTTDKLPTLSIPLCLWSIFSCTVQLTMSFSNLIVYWYTNLSLEVGTIVLIGTSMLATTCLVLTPVVMSVQSSRLARLLHDLSKITEVSSPPMYRWYCKPTTQMVMFSGIMMVIYTAYNAIHFGLKNNIEVVLHVIMSVIFGFGYVLPAQVCSMVFGLLGRRLVAATEATVEKVPLLLDPRGSLRHDSEAEAAILALQDLDTVIWEVELQREAGTRCFFPVVTMSLLMAIQLAISCPYEILKEKLLNSRTIIALGLACYIMVSFCHVGQTFVNKVGSIQKVGFKTSTA